MPYDPLRAIMAGRSYDPLAALLGQQPRDPLTELMAPEQAGSGRPEAYAPAYTDPAERDSALHSILGATMGGLQYIGETLDKPGRAVRGLLGGQGPAALANLIPFSDTLGITDPQ
jgi:hypothetical protein